MDGVSVNTKASAPVVLALVGHSAAGKTDCATLINSCRDGDMDIGLGTAKSPSLETALQWLLDPARPAVVVVSNHEEMLKALHAAKRNDEHRESLARITFIYLHKPKNRLERHLAKPTTGGSTRPQDAQRYTLNNYARFHTLFSDIADKTIDCSIGSTRQIADAVRDLLAEYNAT